MCRSGSTSETSGVRIQAGYVAEGAEVRRTHQKRIGMTTPSRKEQEDV